MSIPDSSARHSSVQPPELRDGLRLQDFSRAILGVSDIARELSALYSGLKTCSPDSILTGHVRQNSVSLRSLLINNKGRLLTRLFKGAWAPAWQSQSAAEMAKVVVEASPSQTVYYTIDETGEQRSLTTSSYTHGFVVGTLPGIGKSGDDLYAILDDRHLWDSGETVAHMEWVRHELFEVDGLVYDLANCIKCVADKEGAHIDKVVDSEGIYTGSRTSPKAKFTNDDVYILSRMVKFGPFSYPHVVVFVVSRYLVGMVKQVLKSSQAEVQSLLGQFALTRERVASTRERIALIMNAPAVGQIHGLPLRVTPERLVMRPPTPLGLASAAEEQALAHARPRYGETYVGIPRRL